ncbi:DUF2147 domain-containing protein [Nitrobacter winogradskyi]|nr:DUF2147 domain-containing protein [Nitrobacter winogradskyi]
MKALGVAAALLLTLSTAQAGENFSFEIGGHTVRIHASRGCDSPSCISISIPGLYNSKRKRFDDADSGDSDVPQAGSVQAPAASSPSAPPPAPAQASATASAPAPAATAPTPAQQPSPSIAVSTPTASTGAPVEPVPSQDTKTVASNVPAAEPPEASPRATEPAGPLGMWVTEKKEGRVRIEECGKNLCGYSVDSRSGRNKEKILINMKPSGSKWSGKIYDPNSGSTYSSTVAMKGKDRLRVQGCAFGGMFCGGQIWTRLNQSL